MGQGARAGMIRNRKVWKAVIGVALFFFLLSGPALAEEEERKKFDLSVAFRYSLPIGEEEPGLDWSDLYEEGSVGALELSYRATRRVAVYVGGAYHLYRAKEISLETPAGAVAGRFNDQELLSVYLGVKGYLFGPALPQEAAGIDPYLRADVGFTQFNGADFNAEPIADRSRKFAFSFGVGADVLTYTNVLLFFEIKYEDHGTPDEAGGAFRAMPISLGIRYLM